MIERRVPIERFADRVRPAVFGRTAGAAPESGVEHMDEYLRTKAVWIKSR